MAALASAQPDRPRTQLPRFGLIFTAWLVPALLSAFDNYMQSRLSNEPPDWRWVLFAGVDWLLYAVLTPAVFRISRTYPLEREGLAGRIALHTGCALGMCVVWATLGQFLRLAIFHPPESFTVMKFWRALEGWIFTTLPFGTGVYFALVGIEHALAYMAQARERETQAVRLTAQLAEARLGALRMQLNPHFLFNSLNAITVLVRDQNTAAASRMLELLSDVLRMVLHAEASHETPLATELDFLERYLAIEQVRFSDRLRPRIEVDAAIRRAAAPQLILQPLVENALRHGIARRADAGLLEIAARRDGDTLVLTVRDDGPGLDPARATAAGVGLANTRARLAALYGDRASLEIANDAGGGVVATIRLPYHEAESDGGAQ
ncbi:MAG TPA: histidine kinase [Bryobacteraceae bacterium]|nr:histidine kinase [Bryobacteraceae bacterium]